MKSAYTGDKKLCPMLVRVTVAIMENFSRLCPVIRSSTKENPIYSSQRTGHLQSG